MENALKTAFDKIKDVLAFLNKVKDKKLKKEKEDLIASLRVFLETNGHLAHTASISAGSDVGLDRKSESASEEYLDVAPTPEEVYEDTHQDDDDNVYVENDVRPIQNQPPTPINQASDTIPFIPCEELRNASIGDFLELKREKSLIKGSWQKRWSVIQGYVLYMYESSNDKKQKEAINLKGCTVTITDSFTKENKRKQRCFQINLPKSEKPMEFCASDKESVAKWQRCIEAASVSDAAPPIRLNLPDSTVSNPSPTNSQKQRFRFNTKKSLPSPSKVSTPAQNEDFYMDTEVEPRVDQIYQDTAQEENYDDLEISATVKKDLPPIPIENTSVFSTPLPPTPAGRHETLPPLPPPANAKFPEIPPVRPVKHDPDASLPPPPPAKDDVFPSGSGSVNKLPFPQGNVRNDLPPPPLPSIPVQNEIEDDDDEEFRNLDARELYQGMWDCLADDTNELSFKRGQIVHIISKEHDNYGWWIAKRKGEIGFVPKDYLMEAYEI